MGWTGMGTERLVSLSPMESENEYDCLRLKCLLAVAFNSHHRLSQETPAVKLTGFGLAQGRRAQTGRKNMEQSTEASVNGG